MSTAVELTRNQKLEKLFNRILFASAEERECDSTATMRELPNAQRI